MGETRGVSPLKPLSFVTLAASVAVTALGLLMVVFSHTLTNVAADSLWKVGAMAVAVGVTGLWVSSRVKKLSSSGKRGK